MPAGIASLTVVGVHPGLSDRRLVCRRDGLPRHAVDYAVRTGRLVRVLPGVYLRPADAAEPLWRERAALAWAGAGSALSHLSALRRYGLPVPDDAAVHVTVPPRAHLAAPAAVRVHRETLTTACRRAGDPVVPVAVAVVTSWPLLPPGDARRAPAILAVSERLVTPAALRHEWARRTRLPGRRALGALLAQIADGCRSELELWGHAHVFSHPSLPRARLQRAVRIGGRLVYLDRAYEDELVDVELDGRRYHFSESQRESDMRRDAALASLGWLPIRFSHERLHGDPKGVRAELAAILARRRSQLARS